MKRNIFIAAFAALLACCPLTSAADSYGTLSGPLSELIDMKFRQQTEEEIGMLKREKDKSAKREAVSAIGTTLEKFTYLTPERTAEVNQFVVSMAETAPESEPAMEGSIVIYMKAAEAGTVKDNILYVFLDGVCVGAGTGAKGIFCIIPEDDGGGNMHELSIISSISGDRRGKVQMFSSSVHFGIKKSYVFEAAAKWGQISGLNLAN